MLGADIRSEFGEIDIYLIDQILKGRFDQRRTVLDAGCGDGRNLVHLLRRGVACYGIDRDHAAIELLEVGEVQEGPGVRRGAFIQQQVA